MILEIYIQRELLVVIGVSEAHMGESRDGEEKSEEKRQKERRKLAWQAYSMDLKAWVV